jgi:hypothetical protein
MNSVRSGDVTGMPSTARTWCDGSIVVSRSMPAVSL